MLSTNICEIESKMQSEGSFRAARTDSSSVCAALPTKTDVLGMKGLVLNSWNHLESNGNQARADVHLTKRPSRLGLGSSRMHSSSTRHIPMSWRDAPRISWGVRLWFLRRGGE